GVSAAAVLAALGTVAGVGLSQISSSGAQYQYGQKVTICHHTHSKTNPTVTITIAKAALPAHQAHGDTVGPCPTQPTTTAVTNKKKTAGAAAAKSHGKNEKAAAAKGAKATKAATTPKAKAKTKATPKATARPTSRP